MNCFAKLKDGRLSIGNAHFERSYDGVTAVTESVCDNGGLSAPFLSVLATREDGSTKEYHVWEDMAAVEMPIHDVTDTLTLTGEHWVVRSVRLFTLTDVHDTFVTEQTTHLFFKGIREVLGNIFYLEDPASKEAMVLMALTPDYQNAVLRIREGVVSLDTFGCGAVFAFCRMGECEATGRAMYRRMWKPVGLHAMSNTWGDKNGWKRVNQDFMRKEIEAAEGIGVDIVQIDDAWQTGCTGDPAIRDEKGRRCFLGNFWDLNAERFPDGIPPLTQMAKERGMKMGLWFAPDPRNDFELLERDKEVLRKAYCEWGIRFFKLDMLSVNSVRGRDRFLDLLATIYSFGNDVSVELDITNGQRLGFLCGCRYGTLFMENRYTGSGNAFPHRVLRNQWMLAHYLPTAKFQFEMVNPDLNGECYGENDPFKPSLYDQDYLFAITMVSNPLYWMEVQFLSEERRAQLKRVIPAWKAHRDVLGLADVIPVGEKPSGTSFPGFCAISEDGKGEDVYLVLFRENTDRTDATYTLPVALDDVTLLASNADADIEILGNQVHVSFEKERSYLFLKAKRV